jgi:hypothetical protein
MLERARKYMGMPASPSRPLSGLPGLPEANGGTPGLPPTMRTPPSMGAPLGPRGAGLSSVHASTLPLARVHCLARALCITFVRNAHTRSFGSRSDLSDLRNLFYFIIYFWARGQLLASLSRMKRASC